MAKGGKNWAIITFFYELGLVHRQPLLNILSHLAINRRSLSNQSTRIHLPEVLVGQHSQGVQSKSRSMPNSVSSLKDVFLSCTRCARHLSERDSCFLRYFLGNLRMKPRLVICPLE